MTPQNVAYLSALVSVLEEVREYIVTSVHNTLALRFLGRLTIAVVALSDKGSKWTAKGFERIH